MAFDGIWDYRAQLHADAIYKMMGLLRFWGQHHSNVTEYCYCCELAYGLSKVPPDAKEYIKADNVIAEFTNYLFLPFPLPSFVACVTG